MEVSLMLPSGWLKKTSERFSLWYADLQEQNAASRRQDGQARPSLAVRTQCPCCTAGMAFLTSVRGEEGELARACRHCHHQFPVEGPWAASTARISERLDAFT